MFATSWTHRRKSRRGRRPAFLPRLLVLEDRTTPTAGALDPTFGVGGVVTTDLPSFRASPRPQNHSDFTPSAVAPHQTAIQADGRIVMVGSSRQPSATTPGDFQWDIALTRYTTSGVVDDTSFGTSGFVGFDFATGPDRHFNHASNMAMQDDGKIVVIGESSTLSGPSFGVVFRLNSDGTLDCSFGTNGSVVAPFGLSSGSVAVQNDGKIVLVNSTTGPNDNMIVAQLNSNGTLDSSFGSNGTQIIDLGGIEAANCVAVQADGSILLGGSTFSEADPVGSFVVVRLTSAGGLDTSFDGDGWASLLTSSEDWYYGVTDLVVQADGKIAFAIDQAADVPGGYNVARLNGDGTPDTSFGTAGRQSVPGRTSNLALAPDGKMIVSSTVVVSINVPAQVVVTRLNGDGSPDDTFGNDGVSYSAGSVQATWPVFVQVQPDGNIIASGITPFDGPTGSDFRVARLLGGASAVTTPAAVADQLDRLAETATLSGQPTEVTFQATTGTQYDTFVAAVNAMPEPGPAAGDVTVTLDLTGDFDAGDFDLPAGVTLVINGTAGQTILYGSSPALTLGGGTLIVRNVTFVNPTDAPTILVTGGTLVLRDCVIEESTGYAQTAISVIGGAVDLGTAVDPGGNTVNVNGPGAFVSNITATPVAAAGTAFTVDAAPLVANSLSGIVWEDFNADGDVNFGERGIGGTSIRLTGADDLGNPIDLSQPTDADGAYLFLNLRPGTYQITETQPAGYLQGINAVGTAGGTVAADQFLIPLGPNADGLNYNFGERPAATGPVQAGQAAGIGFWNNKHGQALIRGFNGGTGTQLGDWLAATLPNTFGVNAGMNNLTGKGNAFVAGLFQQSFLAKGVKLDAQVLATALSVYATHALLDPTHLAAQYGFAVGGTGLGTAAVNVGANGAAFGVANNATLTVMDLLLAADAQAVGGILYGGNAAKRTAANNVFSFVNQAGGI